MRFGFASSVWGLLFADLEDLCFADKQKRERLLKSNEDLFKAEQENHVHRDMALAKQKQLDAENLDSDPGSSSSVSGTETNDSRHRQGHASTSNIDSDQVADRLDWAPDVGILLLGQEEKAVKPANESAKSDRDLGWIERYDAKRSSNRGYNSNNRGWRGNGGNVYRNSYYNKERTGKKGERSWGKRGSHYGNSRGHRNFGYNRGSNRGYRNSRYNRGSNRGYRNSWYNRGSNRGYRNSWYNRGSNRRPSRKYTIYHQWDPNPRPKPSIRPNPRPTLGNEPVLPSPTPAPVPIQTPAPVSSTPAPSTNTPAPVASTPAPSTNTPAPVASTPAPSANTPAPMASTPAPSANTPAPMASTPAPVTPAPTPAPIFPLPTMPAPTAPPTGAPTYGPTTSPGTTSPAPSSAALGQCNFIPVPENDPTFMEDYDCINFMGTDAAYWFSQNYISDQPGGYAYCNCAEECPGVSQRPYPICCAYMCIITNCAGYDETSTCNGYTVDDF